MAHSHIKLCALPLALLLLIGFGDCNPIQIHNLFRRDAEGADQVPSSTPSMMMSSSMGPMMSSHEGHKVNCDGDTSELNKSCPSNDMCPADKDKMEKCCHCLNLCCDGSDPAGGSSSMPSSSSEEGSMGDSTEKPGQNFESKVKGAINSAEGWVKKQGENIKNQWDKAKESIKQTASDVKDKVQKGFDTAKSRFRNSTAHSMENSTDEMSASGGNTTTPTPGHQKSKRDLYGQYGMARPTFYQTRYASEGGSRDSSDSDEYSWSRSTTTTSGNSNSNLNFRRYKRGEQSMMATNNSSDSKLNSGNQSQNSTNTATEKSSRNKRSNSRHSDSSDSDSGSSTLPTVKTSKSTTITEGSVMESGGRGRDSDNSGRNNNGNSRNSRDTKMGSKSNKEENSTSTTQSSASTGSSSSSNAHGSNSEEEEEDTYHSNHEKSKKGKDKDKPPQDNSNVEISVHVLGPNKGGSNGRSGNRKKNSESNESEDEDDYGHSYYSVHSPNERFVKIESSSTEDSEADDSMENVMDHPPIIVYPDGSYGGLLSSSSPFHPHYNRGGGGHKEGSNHHHPHNHSPTRNYMYNLGHDQTDLGYDHHSYDDYDRKHSSQDGVMENGREHNASYIELGDIARYVITKAAEATSLLTSPPGSSSSSKSWGHPSSDQGHYNPIQQSYYGYRPDTLMFGVESGTPNQYRFARSAVTTTNASSIPSRSFSPGNNTTSTTETSVTIDSSIAKPDEANSSTTPAAFTTPTPTTSSNPNSSVSVVSDHTPILFGKGNQCPPFRPGVDCVTLGTGAIHCTFDEDCAGDKKCCFQGCDPYHRLGICYDPIP